MQLEGEIFKIGDVKSVGNNGFKKRELILKTELNTQYPQHILVEFVQDKTELLDAYKVGQNVKIDINLNGREWINPQGEAKYFNAIQGWRIEALEPNHEGLENAKAVLDSAFEPAGDLNEEQDPLPF